ncbi:MAG: DUF4838 domain-containing protein [Planctomycetota bacterium]
MKKSTVIVVVGLFCLVNLFIGCGNLSAGNKGGSIVLVDNGKSNYRIVIPATASDVEKYAADELQNFLQQIAGVQLEIVTDAEKMSKAEILLGNNSHLKKLKTDIDFESLGKEGFTIRSHGKHLIITGSAERGVMYGVYTFLEDYLGCRWYSSTVSHIPTQKTIRLPLINDTQVPVLNFREVYAYDAMDPAFAGRIKLNGNAGNIKDSKMLTERHAGWTTWCHTSFTFVPPEKYFKEHPEYYSLLNGERKAKQLCFSNPEIVDIAAAKVKDLLDNPVDSIPHTIKVVPREGGPIWADKEDIYIDISQQDGGGACQCENCKAIDNREGSPIGSILTFVNKVATRFPDKTFSTLAYYYSQKPPEHIKPADNVSIMLCNYGSSMTFPLADSPSKRFVRDLKKWSEISNNLLIWDYVVNFSNLNMPNPNFHIQQSNIKFYIDHNVKGIFEQASREAGGEFCGLRTYLLAKLMWNPDCNVDAVMNDFLDGYYGPAGKAIRRYIDLMRETLVNAKESIGIYDWPKSHAGGYLSEEMLKQYNAIFDEADKLVAGDEELLHRVRTARTPLMYVELVNGYGTPEERMAILEDFYTLCQKNNIKKLSETGVTPDKFKNQILGSLQREFGVTMTPPGGVFADFENVVVEMKAIQKDVSIHYTLDGSKPTKDSKLYTEPVKITKPVVIKANCFGKISTPVTTARFQKAELPVKTGIMKRNDPAQHLKLPVSDVTLLKLIVKDGGNGNANDHADWADAKLIDAEGNVTYLSDLEPVRVSQGWRTLGIDKSVLGNQLKIGTQKFDKGLGSHANSEILYKLNKKYKYFETYIGVDSGAGGDASVVFHVEAE